MKAFAPALDGTVLPFPSESTQAAATTAIADSNTTQWRTPAHSLTRTRLWLVNASAFFYVFSMHKFSYHDPWSVGTGVQGVMEALSIVVALLLVLIATRDAGRRYSSSISTICFAAFGVMAICSSWRGSNPLLSVTKGVLFLLILGMGYLVSQGGLARRFLLALYYSYTFICAAGLVIGMLLPAVYGVWHIDDYTGRNRLSVFDTHAGTLGEDLLYLLLLPPLLKDKVGWVSQIFLLGLNILSGGKTSTALLAALLLVRFACSIRVWKSWRTLGVVAATSIVLAVGPFSLVQGGGHGSIFEPVLKPIYGTHTTEDASSLDGRVDLWMASIRLLPRAQLLGYGIDGTRDVMLNVAAWAGNSHNGYLDMALASGLLGFGLFFLGVCSVARICWRAGSPYRLYLGSILVSLLITDCIGNTFCTPSCIGTLLLVLISYLGRDAIATRQVRVVSRQRVMQVSARRA